MRILHVFDHSIPLHSGYTFRSLAILRQQRALGWETAHVTGPKQGTDRDFQETVDGFEFYRSGQPPAFTRSLPLVKDQAIVGVLARRLEAVARQVTPEIIHAHSPVLNARAALSVGKKLGIPVVYEIRAFWEDAAAAHGTFRANGIRYRIARHLETDAVLAADAVATICEGLRQDILERGVPEENVIVIPNAVDPDEFAHPEAADAALKSRLGLDDAVVLGFIGSFYGYEGLDLLLEAMPFILARTPRVKLLLVGGGPEEVALKAQAERLSLGDAVIFAGRVPHQEVERYYALVDGFIYPRHPMRLTELVTPLKPLEAMAQRKPVLASDIGGHRELIAHNVTGLLFPAGSPDAIAAAVNGWIADPARSARLLDEAYRYVTEDRTWANSVARYRPVYERLAKKRLGR
ncbi:TIGR04063 family PEP-CTERM/XrtA system glycosyltransferase [Emcibacter sp. SYSU 3D8]|uniref:TIGR04063 family PEP-CTERM/XrtA system glycosyltransferase n=1 Tax=Emcibacter sp. SYSU 3D8 TaxID=3133969 RepID=UPI0031FE8297